MNSKVYKSFRVHSDMGTDRQQREERVLERKEISVIFFKKPKAKVVKC